MGGRQRRPPPPWPGRQATGQMTARAWRVVACFGRAQKQTRAAHNTPTLHCWRLLVAPERYYLSALLVGRRARCAVCSLLWRLPRGSRCVVVNCELDRFCTHSEIPRSHTPACYCSCFVLAFLVRRARKRQTTHDRGCPFPPSARVRVACPRTAFWCV